MDFFRDWKDGERNSSEDYPWVSTVSRVSNWQFRCYVRQRQRDVFLVFLVFLVFEFSFNLRLCVLSSSTIPSIFLY